MIAKANAESAADGVDSFAHAIELGAYTAEEAIPEIIRLLDTLASEAEILMDATYTSITTALIGSFGETLTAMGHDVPETVALFREVYSEAKGELGNLELAIADLNKQYEDGSISADAYADALVGMTDEYRDLHGLNIPEFTDTDEQERYMQQFKEISNPVMVFCEDHQFQGLMSRDDIYAMYGTWCENAGNRRLSREVFFPRFCEQMGQKITYKGRRMVQRKRTMVIEFAEEFDDFDGDTPFDA